MFKPDRQTYYLSVYIRTRESCSPLGRTITSVNTKGDHWICAREKHKLRKGCAHKALAKWFLAEYYPHKLFTYDEDKADKIVVIANDAQETVPEPEYTSI